MNNADVKFKPEFRKVKEVEPPVYSIQLLQFNWTIGPISLFAVQLVVRYMPSSTQDYL